MAKKKTRMQQINPRSKSHSSTATDTTKVQQESPAPVNPIGVIEKPLRDDDGYPINKPAFIEDLIDACQQAELDAKKIGSGS